MTLRSRVADVKRAFLTKPDLSRLSRCQRPFIVYVALALLVGFATGFFTPRLLDASATIWIALAGSLLIVPSLLEELFFRALLISHPTRSVSGRQLRRETLISLGLYVGWHPVWAGIAELTGHPLKIDLLDPAFLTIVTLLGTCCTICYRRTGSVWIPTLIHWLTVLNWVYFLGGRNPLLPLFGISPPGS